MPIYVEDDRVSLEDLEKLRKYHFCKDCGARLYIFYDDQVKKPFLACWNWTRSHHQGIEREASRWEAEGLAALTINKRSEILTQELGTQKATSLAKYQSKMQLTKEDAKEILEAVFPDAPAPEIARAMILCSGYGLNPLMKHVFLIPFNKGKPNETWATVIGIKATRLLASRRAPYSYTDGTPRVMTQQEQVDTFGEYDSKKLWVITKGKDPASGAEAVGYGWWPKQQEPYGTDKGNTKFNMASTRSERQMLERLRPGEMPSGYEVMPEEAADAAIIEASYVEVEGRPVNRKTGEIVDVAGGDDVHWCEEHGVAYEMKQRGTAVWYAHGIEGGGWCNEKKKKTEPATEPDSVSEIRAEVAAEVEAEQASTLEEVPETVDEVPPRESAGRDPETIKTLNELFKACNEDFKLQPAAVLKEMGVKSQADISDTPEECYRKILVVRS